MDKWRAVQAFTSDDDWWRVLNEDDEIISDRRSEPETLAIAASRENAEFCEKYQFGCKARMANTGANDPQDCDWPFCGCDPYADKVMEAIEESGYPSPEVVRENAEKVEKMRAILVKLTAPFDWQDIDVGAAIEPIAEEARALLEGEDG